MEEEVLNATSKEASQKYQRSHQNQNNHLHHHPHLHHHQQNLKAKRKFALKNVHLMEIVLKICSAVQTGVCAWTGKHIPLEDQIVNLGKTMEVQPKKKRKKKSLKNPKNEDQNLNQSQKLNQPAQLKITNQLIVILMKNLAKLMPRDGTEKELNKTSPTTSKELELNLKTQPSQVNMLSSGEIK